MICSMTAFARRELRSELGSFAWEIRSVNQRFLEPSFRLPETLRAIEPSLREVLRQKLTRGKLDCSLRFEPAVATQTIAINENLVEQLQQVSLRLNALGVAGANLTHSEILRWPGVLQSHDVEADVLEAAATKAFEQAVNDLIAMRKREGEALTQLLRERLDGIEQEVIKARSVMPEVQEKQREKLLNRFVDAKVELEPTRLEQEMVMFAQRIDTAEELDRLTTHVQEIRRLLKEGGSIGRRLDFLVQELHREANTLGSKSVSTVTTACSVGLKVLIEQMREQVQNIE